MKHIRPISVRKAQAYREFAAELYDALADFLFAKKNELV